MTKTEEKMIVNEKRIDGRKPDELRKIEMKVGVISRATGSAHVSFGNTVALASVHGPRELFPRWMQESESGIFRCRYNMAPFSVDDRKSPAPDRRSVELSKVIKLAIEPALFLEDFPKATIDAFIEIIEADGSTRVAGINAASLALAHAGIPMKDLVVACSVGKIDGTLIVDLNGKEDNNSECDMAVAMMPRKENITLLQMDGVITRKEFSELLNLAKENCKKIYELQKKALKEKFG
jgi:exosome complex component RRP41